MTSQSTTAQTPAPAPASSLRALLESRGQPITLAAARAVVAEIDRLAPLCQSLLPRGAYDALRAALATSKSLQSHNEALRAFFAATLGSQALDLHWKRKLAGGSDNAEPDPTRAPIAATSAAKPATRTTATAQAKPAQVLAQSVPANTPAAKLATYSSLKGAERVAYFAVNERDIRTAVADADALRDIAKRNGPDGRAAGGPIHHFLRLRSLPVGAARAAYFAANERAIMQGSTDYATAQRIAARNGLKLDDELASAPAKPLSRASSDAALLTQYKAMPAGPERVAFADKHYNTLVRA